MIHSLQTQLMHVELELLSTNESEHNSFFIDTAHACRTTQY